MLSRMNAITKYVSFSYLFLSIGFLIGCENRNNYHYSPCHQVDSNNPLLVWILKDDYQIAQKYSLLPDDVHNEINLKMAEPNQEFNSTDVMKEGLPIQRFIIGGFSKDYAFVFYEKGGFAYTQWLIVINRKDKKNKSMFFVSGRAKTLEELKSIIKNNELCLD